MTWGARSDTGAPASTPGAPLPPHGRPLGRLSEEDFQAVVEKGLLQYSKILCSRSCQKLHRTLYVVIYFIFFHNKF